MLDISTDYLLFDNKETVTYTVYGSGTQYTILNVVRRPSVLATQDEMGTTIYSASQRFVLPKAECPVNFTPKLNDKITDSKGKNYYLDNINDGRLRTSWVVDCTQKSGEGLG